MKEVRLVIVDDHTLVRAGIRALLQKIPGVRVVAEANNGTFALQMVEKYNPDIVLLDIEMPGMNGLDVTAHISTVFPKSAVIILSMHEDQEYVMRAIRAGAKGYLLKGSSTPELELAITAVADGQTFLSPAAAKHVVGDLAERNAQASGPLERLSPRQRQVVELIVTGHSRKQIAAKLNVSPKTVDTYRAQCMEKLQVHDVASLVRFAIRNGLVGAEETRKEE